MARELRIEYKTPTLRQSNSLDALLSGQKSAGKDLWFTPRQLHRELLHFICWETGKRTYVFMQIVHIVLHW